MHLKGTNSIPKHFSTMATSFKTVREERARRTA